jgi:hypothetical protein
MHRRVVAAVVTVAAALALLTAGATPAGAREIRIIGCDSLLNWPCPGPMP